jgi:CRP/FNR family transcriptional regulator, cyclic AMP receptor protein
MSNCQNLFPHHGRSEPEKARARPASAPAKRRSADVQALGGLRTLAGAPLFAALQPADIRALESRCLWRRARAGEWVVRAQSEGTDLFIVAKGHAHAVAPWAERETILADVRDGECLGAVPAIDGEPRLAGLRAVTECIVARMPARVFRECIDRHPSVRDHLLAALAHEVRSLVVRAKEHAYLPVRERLCAELLRLSRTSVAGRRVVSPPPHHAELAARIGAHREAVTRALNALEREGAISRTRSAIVLVDPDQLRRVIDEVA